MKSQSGFINFFKNIFKSFFATQALSSLFLLFFAGLALFMANSKWQGLYENIIHYPLALKFGFYSIKTDLHYIINEGLMSLFFFLVGMEIKREFIEGEISSAKKAALPLLAAIGGSLIPAFIFHFFNQDLPTEKGWGIPMATDIAFAVGVISLLPRKVPFALKIFLLSIAIIDDIIAVLVIALFYSGSISGPFLVGVFASAFLCHLYFKLRINNGLIFATLALALWSCMHESGIHASLSGVILGCLVPNKNFWTQKQVMDSLKRTFSKKEESSLGELKRLSGMALNTKAPLKRLISLFNPYVSYIIMPAFAFANAGVRIENMNWSAWIQSPVSYGILLGLCLGKPLGISLFAFVACKLKLSEKPQNVSWIQIVAASCLAGIGFTMSLFIMHLCFSPQSPAYTNAKLSTIIASSISAFFGLALLLFGKTVPQNQRKGP